MLNTLTSEQLKTLRSYLSRKHTAISANGHDDTEHYANNVLTGLTAIISDIDNIIGEA